jgi:hypothetical protein
MRTFLMRFKQRSRMPLTARRLFRRPTVVLRVSRTLPRMPLKVLRPMQRRVLLRARRPLRAQRMLLRMPHPMLKMLVPTQLLMPKARPTMSPTKALSKDRSSSRVVSHRNASIAMIIC